MRIGIFGGTFNPPHKGHLQAATVAIEALGLDKLYVVPTGVPPHKSLEPDTPSGTARYQMAALLFADVPQMQMLDIELTRQGPSYTIDTVLAIQKLHPAAELFLLSGTDMFLSLEHWHRAGELLNIVTPVVFARADGQGQAIADFAGHLQERYSVTPIQIDHEILEISSTALREMLALRAGRAWLADSVYAEIIARGYYNAKPDFEWLREQAHAMLSHKRIPHVQRTEEEAVRLAQRWDVEESAAREAAILHDITKSLDIQAQLQLCEKYDILADSATRENVKLLHAKTGAAIAKVEFGAAQAVYDAICYHTTGRQGMTTLEKIIYLADYIEPGRDFPEVHALRELAYTDLDKAMLYGLELSLKELAQKGRIPHPDTVEAVRWLKTETE
ncbi:MAG: nicotinate (nicotinamide) nucleotide adenylyltransferase [Oscillospiraceae bacterium]|nr:nicotinate (nicotinamide) nucleotide adenylyltransferase [Oscillospiraceae bacterium]